MGGQISCVKVKKNSLWNFKSNKLGPEPVVSLLFSLSLGIIILQNIKILGNKEMDH